MKRALKPLLLLLVFLLFSWIIYTKYQAFESRKLKVDVTTTTPHQPIVAKSDLVNTTLSKNESNHKIIIKKIKLERKENIQMGIRPKTTNPIASTAQSSHIEIQLNLHLKNENIKKENIKKEPKKNQTTEIVQQKPDATTIRNEIKIKVYCLEILFKVTPSN